MKKTVWDWLFPLIIIIGSIWVTVLIARWIWGTNLPEWLKVLLCLRKGQISLFDYGGNKLN